jgi:hypothetical protein
LLIGRINMVNTFWGKQIWRIYQPLHLTNRKCWRESFVLRNKTY